MASRCESCGKFQKDGIPHDHRRLLGSATIHPDGTATVTHGMLDGTAERYEKSDHGYANGGPIDVTKVVSTDPGRHDAMVRISEAATGREMADPQVDPFVAGRHDLQPRPFKRRWWSKRR